MGNTNNSFGTTLWITAFAMFSMFFGGGNFILPPQLGFRAEDLWLIVSVGFCISAVVIPLLGVLVQAKLQGTIIDVGKKVSPKFALILGILMYSVCLVLPIPRTASVIYELSIEPLQWGIGAITFNIVYFLAVMYLCFNRNKIIAVLGKYLTPIMLVIILVSIINAVFFMAEPINTSSLTNPFGVGLLEGYQTFDGIASLIIGGVITTSLNFNENLSFSQKRRITIFSGIISGVVLFIIYTGFIYTGAKLSHYFSQEATYTEVLFGVGVHTLGRFGSMLLNLVVSIACFTTAVGIITGAADFMKNLFGNSQKVYRFVVIASCIVGVFLGKTGVEYIIKVALPILVLIYPIVIMLIFLNLAPEKYTSTTIFRLTIFVTFLFSLPDFLEKVGIQVGEWKSFLPLSSYSLAWLLPSLCIWGILLLFVRK